MKEDFLRSNIDNYKEELLDSSDLSYLNKFWLSEDALSRNWADALSRIFVINGRHVSISPDMNVDIRMGGVLFTRDEFEEFKRLGVRSGASEFAIIEDIGQKDWTILLDRSFFRFAYPIDVAWDDMSGSCSIAYDVFTRPIRAYYVLTSNGCVGKYSNNDAEKPYDLVFFDKKISRSSHIANQE